MPTKIRAKQLDSNYLTKVEDDVNPKLGAPLDGGGHEIGNLQFGEKIISKLNVTSSNYINWNDGILQKKIMRGNEILKFTNAILGGHLTLLIHHPTHVGDNYNLIFSSEGLDAIYWLNSEGPPNISEQNKTYVVDFICDENIYLAYYRGSY